MSGIFGFWNLDGRPADPSVLAEMAGLLAHRGPDGWASWCDGSVAIGHRMFRVTPESLHEALPLTSRDGLRVLTADLRLDNRDDLIRRFGLRASQTLPDAELTLRAYETFGSNAPQQLLGAFSFGVWDSSRQELVCARDHFGEKPLYYCHLPGRLFAFASEIKALWALSEVPDDINDLEVARHLLVPVREDMSATYYRAVRRLPAGSTLTVSRLRCDERPYWTLDDTRVLRLPSDKDYADAVRETFVEAVRCRLRARGPVASMLSGGIDSSSVTCVAARLLAAAGSGQRLRTVSAVYPNVAQSDERAHIQKVLDAYDLQCSFVRGDTVSPIADIECLNWHGGGANWAGNLYINSMLYRTAAAAGARVVLDGYDGDSTLSHGQGWLVELALAGRWWTLSREVKAKAEILGEPWLRAVLGLVRAYGISPALRKLGGRCASFRNHRHSLNASSRWLNGLASDFAETISGEMKPSEPPLPTDRQQHRRLMTRSLLLHMLDWVEAIGAGSGVEVRCPFFDVRLVELCVSLPGRQKLRHGVSRFVMREAMAEILPNDIRRRHDKSNLGPGFVYALRPGSDQEIDQSLSKANAQLSRYVDPTYCAELHRRFMTGTASSAENLRHWRIFSLALWLMGSNGARNARGHRARHESRAAAPRRFTTKEEHVA